MRFAPVLVAPVLLALLIAGAGCGGGEDGGADVETRGNAASAVPAPGGGLTVREARASTLHEPLLVRGSLVARGDEVRLCSALAESYPPQCGEPSLVVRGLDLDGVPRLQRSDDGRVRWAERASVLGHVEGGVLTASKTSIAHR